MVQHINNHFLLIYDQLDLYLKAVNSCLEMVVVVEGGNQSQV